MSLLNRFRRVGPSGLGASTTADQALAGRDLTGRTYLITGTNAGIGHETLRALVAHGATVVATARTLAKAEGAAAAVGGHAVPLACDLEDPASIRACVAAVAARGLVLDGIVANAGVMALPERQLLHGVEKQLAVNHLGHVLLVTGLLDHLAPDGRVVVLSSSAHTNAPPEGIRLDDLAYDHGYDRWKAYGQSKLANLLFARELSRRLEGTARVACAVHPGVIATDLARHLPWVAQVGWDLLCRVAFKTIPEGAATSVWAVAVADPAVIDGQFLADCNVATSSPRGRDAALARRLWERSEALVAPLR